MVGEIVGAVVVLTADVRVAKQVETVIRDGNGLAVVVESLAVLRKAVDREFPVLILIDLAMPDSWQEAVIRYKLQPQTWQIPIHVFGSPVDEVRRESILQSGVDALWEQGQFMAGLPQFVDQHLHPPTIYPDGWDDQLSDLARQGLAEFNRGEYFEQHEFLETAWMAEERPIRKLYQGILQVGVAFLQIERGNWYGTVKMLRRGLPKLRTLPDHCQGIELVTFRCTAEQIHAEVTALGPECLHEFDRSRFPQIRYR